VSVDDDYLIWSNEHQGWWRPNERGYDSGYANAGRYTRERAIQICQNALPTAAHIGIISEIPVRVSDFEDVLRGNKFIPASVFRSDRFGEDA
jgi:hypothetical protein